MTEMVVALLMLLALGVLFALGKGGFLIAGWNMMSPQERARYDEKAVFRNMSAMMFFCAGCLTLILLGKALDVEALGWVGSLLVIPCVIFFAVRVNTAGKK
ncbi:MAG: DUF3784 domain-containing protein [Oscillospiraceae bacterium]|nr:DUF3784 domain-containing protein [Oscillospiraceae bacterium]